VGAGSPSNIMTHGPRPTSVRSGTLIYPTVWPEYTNLRPTDRQDRQRSDSIGRTVLQTVAQKFTPPPDGVRNPNLSIVAMVMEKVRRIFAPPETFAASGRH